MNDTKADKRRNQIVKALYFKLFGVKWPKGWDIKWHVQGLTSSVDKRIYMFAHSFKDPYDFVTLIHEMLHVNSPDMHHGKAFERKVRKLVKEAKGVISKV